MIRCIFTFLLVFGLYLPVFGKTLKVAVIDTGIEAEYLNNANLCLSGHKSFVDDTITDYMGHGTNVVGLINTHAKGADYCLIVIKFANRRLATSNATNFIKALEYIKELKPDIVNISVSGPEPITKEKHIIKQLLDRNIKIVVAAGNEERNLNISCKSYPACYDERLWVISAFDISEANTGAIVDAYLTGKEQTAYNITLSGSSQAAAIFTGKLVNTMSKGLK